MRTQGPRVAKFLETYCVHPKGARFGEPFVLEPWQRHFINEAFRVKPVDLADEETMERVLPQLGERRIKAALSGERPLFERVYRQILLGIPRGNGKTPLAAGLGLFELMARKDTPEIFNVAGAKDQAHVLTDFAKAFVDRGANGAKGTLATWLKTQSKSVVHKETQGVLKLLSSAGSLQHGLSVSASIIDEVHAILHANQVETVNALWTALHKRFNAYQLGITTAGFNKATHLGQAFDQALAELELEFHRFVDGIGPCLVIGRDEPNGSLLWWYGPPETRWENGKPGTEALTVDDVVANEEVWRAVNPASWVSVQSLRQQLAGFGFDDYDWARLHANMWTQTRDVFIPPVAWKQNRRPDLELERKRPLFIGVDIGITHDTSAVGWSQPVMLPVPVDPQVPHGATVLRRHTLNRVRVWSANPEHERDESARHIWVPGGRVQLEDLEEFILQLAHAFQVKELVYDPTFFEGEAQRLARKGITLAPLYQANVLPTIAYQQLYKDVKEGWFLHPGDRVLDAHVAATAGKKTERGWKIYKLAQSEHARAGDTPDRPIDATPAVAYASWRAMIDRSSTLSEKGIRSVGGSDDDEDEWADEFDVE